MKSRCEDFKIGLKKDSIKSQGYNLFPSDLNEVEEFIELLDMNGFDY